MTWPMGLRLTCIAAPIQVEGRVDGGYVYFRARGDEWQLAIGHDQDAAVWASLHATEPFCYVGQWAHAPDDYDAAQAILREHLPMLRLTADDSPQDVTSQEALGDGADPMEGFYEDRRCRLSRFKCCSCCTPGNTQRCGFNDGPRDDHASPCRKCEPEAYEAFTRTRVDPGACGYCEDNLWDQDTHEACKGAGCADCQGHGWVGYSW